MIPQVLTTQGEDFFQQLLFGWGAPFAFLLFASISLILVLKYKEASIIFIPFSLFMGFFLSVNIPTESYLWYICIFYFFLTVGLSLITANHYLGD